MTGALILWGHAIAALAFGLLALDQANRARGDWPKAALVVALATTSLWALAVAGIDSRDIANPIVLAVRDIAWFAVMGLLVRRHRTAGIALVSVYAVAIGMTIATAALALVATAPIEPAGLEALAHAGYACRMMAAVAALVLAHHLASVTDTRARWLARPAALMLGAMWGAELLMSAFGYLGEGVPPSLVIARGFVMGGAAVLFGVMAKDGGEWRMAVSRGAALRALSVVALIAYAGVTIWLTTLARHVPAGYVRIVQTAVVLGSATALMTLVSTPWLRAWTRVKLAKHLFRHRYDYRTEWQRFTTTLGLPGLGADPLDLRIVKAIANLTDAPAGLLLAAHACGLEPATSWRWDGGGEAGVGLATYLETTSRIVELDMVRSGRAEAAEAAEIPDWMIARADAWVLVPLIHHATLVGAILLARPPVDRALDWEDLDLLRVAGRQAASYLAEERAHGALADAQRFDEFNRRFAFILHDIKNLVSGLTLVARNAERHADNPEFRADMIATLQDSVARMNGLLARLSQHHHSPIESAQPVDVGALAARLSAPRRAQHRIEAVGSGIAIAQPGRLEQLLRHLLQNAIEASAPDDPVTVQVTSTDGRVCVEVVDHGCGMSPAFVRDQLFRPFASSKSGGFGIGAYEARQLAEAMGGSIAVDSREGVGTCFRVSLPAALALEAAA